MGSSVERTADIWSERGLVVLCGAGVSIPPPSGVPSWWGFNEAVLRGVKRKLLDGMNPPADVRAAIEGLDLAELGVTRFSQHVHDAFSGESWFALLRVLDGTDPNAVHRSLAALAADGILRMVVTTNFDTLLERAFRDAGVALEIAVGPDGGQLLPFDPHDRTCRVVKVHGTVTTGATMVDLANQKARGLDPALRALLGQAFAAHAVLVLGFSGADLDLGADYLGLLGAAPRTPWLRWLVRPGTRPHPRAEQVLAAVGGRGRFVEGDLPSALAELGVPLVELATQAGPPATGLDEVVGDWLSHPAFGAMSCGVLLARLLSATNRAREAERLRAVLRARALAAVHVPNGLESVDAAEMSLVLHQLGNDELHAHPGRAIADISLSMKLAETVHSALESAGAASEGHRIEYARNKRSNLLALAQARLRLGHTQKASGVILELTKLISELPAPEQGAAWAEAHLVGGMLAFARGARRHALVQLRRSAELAEAVGRPSVAAAARYARAQLWAKLGLLEMARRDAAAAQTFQETSTVRQPVPLAELFGIDADAAHREQDLRAVLAVVTEEVSSAGALADELLAAAVSLGRAAPSLTEIALRSLEAVLPNADDDGRPGSVLLLGCALVALGLSSDALDEAMAASAARLADDEVAQRLVLDTAAAEVMGVIGRRIAQHGVSAQRRGDFAVALRQFGVAAAVLTWSGDTAEAQRAYIYTFDALLHLNRLDDAAVVVEEIRRLGVPSLQAETVSRSVKLAAARSVVAGRVAGTDLDTARQQVDWLRHHADPALLGASLIALSQMEDLADDGRARALALAEEALERVPRRSHRTVQAYLDDLRQRTGRRG